MPNDKFNTDPELHGRLKEEVKNWRSQSRSFKSFFSADTSSSLEEEVFLLELYQTQATEKKASISHTPRFYISSSDNSEDSDNVTYRRYTL